MVKAHPIVFGTDGWRGIISREVTMDSVSLFARAVARVMGPGAGVMVGYDTRFLSPEYAELVAKTLLADGVRVCLASAPCPSPALSWAVANGSACAGLMVTASHNPAIYNGIKVKCARGGPAPAGMIHDISTACDALSGEPRTVGVWQEDIPSFDPVQGYLEALLERVDRRALAALAGECVVVDAFHGAAAGYMERLLGETGIRVVEIRGELNPTFGGTGPEPRPETATELGRAYGGEGAIAGFMFDGDGDRLAAWDEPGGFVDAHGVFLLLIDHLARGLGRSGSVVRTSAVTSMVDTLAQRLGLPLVRKPVGFGHVRDAMLTERVLIGGEEAGGFGFGDHIPDRDALLAALRLLEMVGTGGKTMRARLNELTNEVGRLHFKRLDVSLAGRDPAEIAGRLRVLPESIAGLDVVAVESADGVRLELEGAAWLLIRESGTEPLVRLYAEAPSRVLLDAVLEAGNRLVTGT